MMTETSFCAFILSHGRADKVFTWDYLKRHGYTGKTFVIIDDEDKTRQDYIDRFGDSVLVFSKEEIAKTFDIGDNFGHRKGVIYARNACFALAKQVGYKYFIALDDDYTNFRYKLDDKGQYSGGKGIKNLDLMFDCLLDYYKSIPALSIAMAQGGDFIGGEQGSFARVMKPRRKCMNTFICSTDRPFQFMGRINEDVNAYAYLGYKGDLFLTIPNVAIQQVQTQKTDEGMTTLYRDYGTYVKSFYSVMYCPASIVVKEMGSKFKRLHHKVKWKNTVPQILDESYKKPAISTSPVEQ